jgi:hypothetical protein
VDSTNRLQVFDPKGKHLCTRSDLRLQADSDKGIAWSAGGEIAVADAEAHCVRLRPPTHTQQGGVDPQGLLQTHKLSW